MTGPAGLDIVSFYPDYHPQGLEVLIVASSLPSLDLTYENGQLYFAGVDFKWGIDPAQWTYSWGNGVTSNGWMMVDLETMQITDIQAGWDSMVVRNAIEEGLGI